MTDHQVVIVLAAYNEAATIREVVKRLLVHYPVVVVDDGSTDGTLSQLSDLDVYRLRHVLNRGQGASLQTGITFALEQGADVIVTFDADGQHHEKDIAALVGPVLRRECEVCLGSRFLGAAHNIPATRRFILKVGVAFARFISGLNVTDVHNGLRAFSRAAACSLDIKMDRMAHASEILDHIKKKRLPYKEVPVDIYYSESSLRKGQSSWNALRIAFEVLFQKLAR